MIRMIQRRLIIPRGDTGSFSIPYLKTINAGDVAVFTIFDPRTHTKLYQKLVAAEGDVLNIAFSHSDTVNLKPGKYLWDIKFYTNPQFVDDELVNGDEIDSYYAGFTLPECEIRQTGDTLLTSDDAPTSTMSPESLDIINAAINEVLRNKGIAESAAATATEKADQAAESAESASNSASAASQSAELAEARVNEIENLSVEVSTGAEGTEVTATYTPSTGILSFEIPRGNTGNGIASCVLNADFTLTINYTDGTSMTTVPIRGDTPHLTIGQVTEGPHAIATITGTDANPILNLTLPNANVPTKLSQLTDDIGVAGKANSADLAVVATSGSYEDLSDKPTIPEVPVQDVQVNGTSILDNGVANVPYADSSTYGLVKTGERSLGINGISGALVLGRPYDSEIKEGTLTRVAIDPANQHKATFYGLAKAAGDTTQSQSSNAVGVYTDEAKAAIQQMLDVPSTSDIPTQVSELTNDAGYLITETDPTVPAWAKAATKPSYTASEVGAPTVQEMNDAIAAINTMNIHICAQGEYNAETGVPTIQNPDAQTFYLVPGGEGSNLFIEWAYVNGAWERFGSADVDLSNYVQKTDYATMFEPGVIQAVQMSEGSSSTYNGVALNSSHTLRVYPATENGIKSPFSKDYAPIVPKTQHISTFYGLAKAAGDSTQSQSDNAVGAYTAEAKAAIRSMIGAAASADLTVQDVQVNGSSILNNGIANIPYTSDDSYGVMKTNPIFGIGSINGFAMIAAATIDNIKSGINGNKPIVSAHQHESTFYGLAKVAGDTTQSQSDNAVGTYTDEAKAAIQQMLDVPSTNDIPVESGTGVGSVKTKNFVDNDITYTTTASGVGSFAEGGTTLASGSFSHAEGQNTQASAFGAHAEGGSATTASGMFTHAEGWGTIASKPAAHSEGYNTNASGNYSHAEGRGGTASGANSHVEGYGNTASGNAAHAEGRGNTASGQNSHVEGQGSIGTGMNSHTEGFYTIGHGQNVHVEGKYNVEDQLYPAWVSGTEYQIGDKIIGANNFPYECITANSDEEFDTTKWANIVDDSSYAHIVGNGEYNARSNAYALDWDGNGHYMGDVYVHANADSSGGTKLATVNDIPEVSVTDVQVNGVSVLTNGVANVPISNSTTFGVAKSNTPNGVYVDVNGFMRTSGASRNNEIKFGANQLKPIVPYAQDMATFYGLAKAAGSDEKNSSLPAGQYTESAKSAIQHMLGITQMLAPENPNLVASQAYAIGDVFAANGHLYKATAAIAQDEAIIPDTNCVETTMIDAGGKIKDVQVNGTSVLSNGIVNIQPQNGNGIGVDAHDYSKLVLIEATDYEMKVGGGHRALTGTNQHKAAFYGLAKAAGDTTMASSSNAVGTYTDTAKTAIRSMLGATSSNVIAVQDTQPTNADTKIWLPETAETPVEVPTVAEMNAALSEKVDDVQVNGTSVVSGGVANVPKATYNSVGVVKAHASYGVGIWESDGSLRIDKASDANIKGSIGSYMPIVPSTQHTATFYGLAKAAGDTTQAASDNAVGTYTDNAKASIKAMLGIVDGSTGTVDVSGTTPTITAVENTRYVCGEVTSLSFTPPASGISIVRFTSGSTVTVLTLPSTVKFPEWFDPTSLETNTIYEICITDGIYGAVMSWAQ